MTTFKTLLITLIFGSVCTKVSAQTPGDRILGVYRVVGETTNELSKVKIYRNGDTYDGRIIWLEHPLDDSGNPRLDALNPDPSLRSIRADNIVIVRGLRYDEGKKRWTGGTIYNPVDGKSYDVFAEFESPSQLRVRGYLGKPILGKNYLWDKLE